VKITRCRSTAQVSQRVIDIVRETLQKKPDANLVLPTGATPLRLYHDMVAECVAGRLDLRHAHVFQLDELLGVPPADQRSYYAFLRRTLLDHVPRDPGRDHLLDGATADPVAHLAAHRKLLEDLGGADLALLGLGRNGHVALNEPGSDLDTRAAVAQLHDTTFQVVARQFGPDAAPTHGLTLGMTDLARARRLCLIVLGENKAVILHSVMAERKSPLRPASLLRDLPGMELIADDAACMLLPDNLAATTG